MKNILTSLFLAIGSLFFCQQQYQSLFWEITGKNLDQPSYLYGTMHVSNKIAFRLSDAFYEALYNADKIALESNPNIWLDEMENDNSLLGAGSYYKSNSFYRSFAPNETKKEHLGYYLSQSNQHINGILYRGNEYGGEFQEDTYLDMFLFQSGSKYKKPVIGLENFKRSRDLVAQATSGGDYMKRDYAPWLTKLINEKGIRYIFEDVYREQNLDLMDSINTEMYSERYNKYMLYIRNNDIVVSLDSLLQLKTGNVFTGVGAAHLPGEKGVINMLKKQGYTLKPIKGKLTQKGKNIKEKIEKKENLNFSNYSSSDKMYSIDWVNKMYDLGSGIAISPDLTNGGYLIVSRINKFNYLHKNPEATMANLDYLLFEFVPGDITEKKKISLNGFKGLSIKNKLKKGDIQRYAIYETPLEIIIFKMSGQNDFVNVYGDKVFNSIQLKPMQTDWQQVNSIYKDFNATMPAYYKFDNNGVFSSKIGNTLFQAYNPDTQSFYFLKQKKLTDLEYVEEDEFENEIIAKRFFEELEIDSVNLKDEKYAIGYFKNQTPIRLKTFIKNNSYYLLGTQNASEKESDTFFNHFNVTEAQYSKNLKFITDTTMHFTAKAYNKPPNSNYGGYGSDEIGEKNKYKSKSESYAYFSPNNEKIEIDYYKFNDYKYYESLDALWEEETHVYFYEEKLERKKEIEKRKNAKNLTENKAEVSTTSYSKPDKYNKENNFELKSKEKCTHQDKFPCYKTVLHSKLSSKQIETTYILNQGVLYKIQSQQDTLLPKSKFYTQFIKSFTPKDTLIGRSPLEDKTEMLISHLDSKDSILQNAAFKSIRQANFIEKHLPKIIQFIKNHEFKDKELQYKSSLIKKFEKVNDPKNIALLENLYLNSENDSDLQASILAAIANPNNEKSVSTVLNLLQQDIALPNSQYLLHNIFNTYTYEKPEVAKKFFPKIFQYISIPEYKEITFETLEYLKDSINYPPKKYKSIKNLLITELKMGVKKLKNEELRIKSLDYYYGKASNTNDLQTVLNLLVPFYKDEEVKTIFKKIFTVDNIELKLYTALLLEKNNLKYNPNNLEFLSDITKSYEGYLMLEEHKKLSLLKPYNLTQKDIAIAKLHQTNTNKIDKFELLATKILTQKEESYEYFIFKYINKKEEREYSYKKEEKWKFAAFAFKKTDGLKINTYENIFDNYTYEIIDENDPKELQKFTNGVEETILYHNRKRVDIKFSENNNNYYY